MLVDPLDAFDAYTNQPQGCLWVSLAASILSALLWQLDRRVMKREEMFPTAHPRPVTRLQLIRKYEVTALRGCLKLLCVAAVVFALMYMGRALLLK